jgi:2-methylcitrate dehydratase PrpD
MPPALRSFEKAMIVTVLETLGSALAQARAEDIPASVTDKLKIHTADVIGAWIAGAHTAEGRALIGFRASAGNDASNVADAVATNCALARLSEVDDIHLASMTTPGSIVVPGALTLARSLSNADAGEVTAAILCGYEAMIRLGLAINGPAVLYRGIWPTYFAAPFGIAAVAARLLRLDGRETAHALALALTLASPGVGHHNAPTTSRWFAAGNAARNGVIAALAAKSGFTSDLKFIDGGFLANVYGLKPNPAALADDVGRCWMLAEVSFKPWCAARQTMAATQALGEILASGVAAADITEISAQVLPPHLRMIDHGVTAGDRASHLTSLQYQMAIAALAPEQALDVAQSPTALAPAVQSFMQRITVAGDDALLAEYPAAWPARIAVITSAGTRERLVTHVPGDPTRPLDQRQIAAKFATLVAPVIGPERANEMFNRIADGVVPAPALADEIGRLTQ